METNQSSKLSSGSVLHEVIDATKELAQSEMSLVRSDFSATVRNLKAHAVQGAIFGGMLVLSALPFLAFLVIGLGDLMDGRYWLSSLIVAAVCAIFGGTMASRALKALKDEDFDMPHARRGLERELRAVQEKIHDVKDATKRRTI